MKTTIDLPDDLVRDLKIKAAQENRRYKDVVADVVRHGLWNIDAPLSERSRVQVPLITVPHAARPGEEPTPERVNQILLDDDLGAAQR